MPAKRAPSLGVSIMSFSQSGQMVSRISQRMMRLLLNISGHEAGVHAPGGVPAGSVHVPEARLILASTSCMAPLFKDAMLAAAQATKSDVLLMRHGLFPESLEPTMCDLVLYLNGCPAFVPDMLLYHHPEDGFWLVPAGIGPHVAIERDGLRVAEEAPYYGWAERSDALCRAARLIVQHARRPGGY